MLGCIQPMSSPMMNMMFGLRPLGAFCCAVTPVCCACCDMGVGWAVGGAPLSRSFGGSSAAEDVLEASQPSPASETVMADSASEVKRLRVCFNALIQQSS